MIITIANETINQMPLQRVVVNKSSYQGLPEIYKFKEDSEPCPVKNNIPDTILYDLNHDAIFEEYRRQVLISESS